MNRIHRFYNQGAILVAAVAVDVKKHLATR